MYEIKLYRDIDGWLLPDEAETLYLLAMLLPLRSNVVEIGSWKGKSTYCLAKGLPRGGQIFAIDPFDASGEPGNIEVYQQHKGDIPLLDQFRENMSRHNVMSRITPMKGFSYQFVGQIPRIDLLFIDGDHSIKACDFDFSTTLLAFAQGVTSRSMISTDKRRTRDQPGLSRTKSCLRKSMSSLASSVRYG
jgi:hypothetical protein